MSNKSKTKVGEVIQSNRSLLQEQFDPLAVIHEAIDYMKFREGEETKRDYIEAKRDVIVHALDNEKEVILTYFDRRFSERGEILNQFFVVLHEGIAKENTKEIDTALTGILGVLQDNPLKDLAEFRKNMANPDFVIEL